MFFLSLFAPPPFFFLLSSETKKKVKYLRPLVRLKLEGITRDVASHGIVFHLQLVLMPLIEEHISP